MSGQDIFAAIFVAVHLIGIAICIVVLVRNRRLRVPRETEQERET